MLSLPAVKPHSRHKRSLGIILREEKARLMLSLPVCKSWSPPEKASWPHFLGEDHTETSEVDLCDLPRFPAIVDALESFAQPCFACHVSAVSFGMVKAWIETILHVFETFLLVGRSVGPPFGRTAQTSE